MVNGDKDTILGALGYENSAAKDGTDGKWTDNAGTYKDAIGLTGTDSLSNYEVTVNKGDAVIGKADLVISIDNSQTVIGSIPDKEGFTGTDIENELVNGDKLDFDYSYGIAEDDSVFEEVSPAGGYEIGVVADGHFYNNGEELGSAFDDLFKNYTVTVMPGILTVTEKSTDAKIDPNNPNGYLYQEGWGWKRNFRERKAEVHFEDGGVKTPQSL